MRPVAKTKRKNHAESKKKESFSSSFGSGLTSSGGQDDPHDETVQSQSFGENEDKNHTNEKLWLLSIGPEPSKEKLLIMCY